MTRDLGAIKNEIVDSIDQFLSQRCDVDQRLVGILRPFVSIQAGDIKKVHNVICTDLDLTELTLEFEDVLRSGDADDIRKLKLRQLVERLSRSKNIYPNMIIALSGVLAAKPHSCDVQHLISACNLLKTSMRNHIDRKTQNLYLYVHLNMKKLEEWDPRPCIIRWLNQKSMRRGLLRRQRDRWFKGVLKEANVVNDESDDEEDEVDKTGQNSQKQ